MLRTDTIIHPRMSMCSLSLSKRQFVISPARTQCLDVRLSIMERIDARFVVPTQPLLTDGIRIAISNHDRFNLVSAKNVNDIWEGEVPHSEKLTVEMNGTVISLMDDWQCIVLADRTFLVYQRYSRSTGFLTMSLD